MRFLEAVEYVEKSEVFKELEEGFYLVHGFMVIEKGKQTPWQIGYYSQEKDKIVVFLAEDEVKKNPEEEAFKKEGVVEALKKEEISSTAQEALAVVESVRKEKYSAEQAFKTLVILQHLEGKCIWNITLITHSFSMINVRVSAETKEVLSEEKSSILHLGKKV